MLPSGRLFQYFAHLPYDSGIMISFSGISRPQRFGPASVGQPGRLDVSGLVAASPNEETGPSRLVRGRFYRSPRGISYRVSQHRIRGFCSPSHPLVGTTLPVGRPVSPCLVGVRCVACTRADDADSLDFSSATLRVLRSGGVLIESEAPSPMHEIPRHTLIWFVRRTRPCA